MTERIIDDDGEVYCIGCGKKLKSRRDGNVTSVAEAYAVYETLCFYPKLKGFRCNECVHGRKK